MTRSFSTRLTLPADKRFLSMVQGYVRELAAGDGPHPRPSPGHGFTDGETVPLKKVHAQTPAMGVPQDRHRPPAIPFSRMR